MVIDGIDKQSNAFAQTMFCPEVEEQLSLLGFTEESTFCHLIREWYEAEDEPGIPASDRHTRRMALRNYLLKGVDLHLFPPPGTHVKGYYYLYDIIFH